MNSLNIGGIELSYSKTVKALIKKRFTPFAQENGFWFYKSDKMLRISENILHSITFEVFPDHFYCNVAVQPLYVPKKHIVLNCGARLDNFKVNIPVLWGYKNRSVEQDLSEIEGLLTVNAIPWFKEVGNPQGLCKFLQDEERIREFLVIFRGPWLRFIYLGFTLLYLQDAAGGVSALQRALECLSSGIDSAWVNEWRGILQTMIDLAGNDDEVQNRLEEFIEYSKTHIGLK